MYIWIACDVSDSLSYVREFCRNYNGSLGLNEVAFSLPQHISLKISFEVADSDTDAVVKTVSDYLGAFTPFSLDRPVPEQNGNILCLSFSESDILTKLHGDLDRILLQQHGVGQHKFDLEFKFHSTLFIDDNDEAMAEMYGAVSSLDTPDVVTVDRFIIGTSKSGKAGEYSVLKTVYLK